MDRINNSKSRFVLKVCEQHLAPENVHTDNCKISGVYLALSQHHYVKSHKKETSLGVLQHL